MGCHQEGGWWWWVLFLNIRHARRLVRRVAAHGLQQASQDIRLVIDCRVAIKDKTGERLQHTRPRSFPGLLTITHCSSLRGDSPWSKPSLLSAAVRRPLSARAKL
jgi:hypothetical protein